MATYSKTDLGFKKLEAEIRLTEAEVSLRKADLEIRKASSGSGTLRLSPLTTGIIATIAGLLGTSLGAGIHGWSSIQTEKLKFQSSLVLHAIETGDSEVAAKNLAFLVKAGFLDDESGAIAGLAEEPSKSPVLPARAGTFGAPPGYTRLASFSGDCKVRPPGSICAQYSDGYVWLISDVAVSRFFAGSLQGREIEAIGGEKAVYLHILGTDLVQFQELETKVVLGGEEP